jgi:hypothetical protein
MRRPFGCRNGDRLQLRGQSAIPAENELAVQGVVGLPAAALAPQLFVIIPVTAVTARHFHNPPQSYVRPLAFRQYANLAD